MFIMSDEIDLSNLATQDQIDSSFRAMEIILDRLIRKNEINMYFKEELLTDFHTTEHSLTALNNKIDSILNKINIRR